MKLCPNEHKKDQGEDEKEVRVAQKSVGELQEPPRPGTNEMSW